MRAEEGREMAAKMKESCEHCCGGKWMGWLFLIWGLAIIAAEWNYLFAWGYLPPWLDVWTIVGLGIGITGLKKLYWMYK